MAMELSLYERERQENMKRNAQHLESLGLSSIVPPAPKKKRSRAEASIVDREPSRRSSRLQNVAAPNVYVENEADEQQQRRPHKSKGGSLVSLGGEDAAAVLAENAAEAADMLPIEPEDLTPTEREVYEIIREARNAKARSMERSMFIVCGNRTMVEMCRLVPSTPDELLELHGMGELKVQRYGALLLDALRPHAERLLAEHASRAAAASDGAQSNA